ncbi:DUF3068 domain-containing protein [Nocardioides sp. Bht2]|uniref:DUF3068 domain-containing protein n=1 Tax=Nocardioides sp. Bht2 TaxID=3392297 RepID=UPI0039B5E5AF
MLDKVNRILLGVALFALTAAALLRLYAYDQLAVAPIDQSSVTTLTGPGATIFDTGQLAEIQVDLTTTAKTVGLVRETEKEGNDVRVWETTTSTRSDDGVVRSRSVERIAFDAYTGEAVNCCGAFDETVTGDRVEVERKGQLVKFPFQTKKKTYTWWDSSLSQGVPIKFVKEEDVKGLGTYKFEQTIEPTVLSKAQVPASVLGEEGSGNLEAEMTYSNVRTLWVEPRTGVVIKRAEQQFNTIRYNGEDRVTTTKVTTGFDDKTVQENVDTYGSLSTMLFLLRTLVPALLVVLAILLGAIIVLRSRRRPSDTAS